MNRKISINIILILATLYGSASSVFAYGQRNRRSNWRQPKRRHRGQNRMFSPFGGLSFRQPIRSSSKFTGIEQEIENLFSNTIKPIADELKNIKTGKPAQQAVARKVKDREQRFQQVQRQRAQRSRSRGPSRSRYRSPYSRPFGRSPFGRSRYRSPHNSWQPGKRWSPGGFGGSSSPWRNTKSFSPSSWKPDHKRGSDFEPRVVDQKKAASKTPKTSNNKNYTPSLGKKKKKVSSQLVKARTLRNRVLQAMQHSIKQLKHPKRDPEAGADDDPKANYERDLVGQFKTIAGHIAKMNDAFDALEPKQIKVERSYLNRTYREYLKYLAKGFADVDKAGGKERGASRAIFEELIKQIGANKIKSVINSDLTQYIEKGEKDSQAAIRTIGDRTKTVEEKNKAKEAFVLILQRLKNIKEVFEPHYKDERLNEIIEKQEEEKDRLDLEKPIQAGQGEQENT